MRLEKFVGLLRLRVCVWWRAQGGGGEGLAATRRGTGASRLA